MGNQNSTMKCAETFVSDVLANKLHQNVSQDKIREIAARVSRIIPSVPKGKKGKQY